jgi:hypothetical protein
VAAENLWYVYFEVHSGVLVVKNEVVINGCRRYRFQGVFCFNLSRIQLGGTAEKYIPSSLFRDGGIFCF